MIYEDIAQQLLQLAAEDLQLRQELIERGELFDAYHPEMEAMHNRNAEALDEIIEKIGFPTIDKVGSEASAAAWLIVQHAIGQPAIMRKCLSLLEDATQQAKVNPVHVAYLYDRIAVFENRLQLYGTAFDWDEAGNMSPMPYDDIDKVNARRAQLGMSSLEDQTTKMREEAIRNKEHAPEDYEQRRIAYLAWRRKVGWIK